MKDCECDSANFIEIPVHEADGNFSGLSSNVSKFLTRTSSEVGCISTEDLSLGFDDIALVMSWK